MMKTSADAEARLQRIYSYPLLSRCGQPLSEQDECGFELEPLASWEAFFKAKTDESLWLKVYANTKNLGIDARLKHRKDPGRPWGGENVGPWFDQLIKDVDVRIEPIVHSAVSGLATRKQCLQALSFMICETISAEQCRPIMTNMAPFDAMETLLKAGRVIAGWRGRFPNGRLLVF